MKIIIAVLADPFCMRQACTNIESQQYLRTPCCIQPLNGFVIEHDQMKHNQNCCPAMQARQASIKIGAIHGSIYICTNKSDMHKIVELALALAILPNELFLLLIGYVSNSHTQFCGNCLLDTLYKSSITLPLRQ